MSSFPPNAHRRSRRARSMTTARCRSRAPRAMSSRSSQIPWPPEYTYSVLGRRGCPTRHRSAPPASTPARGRRARCAGSGRSRPRRVRPPQTAPRRRRPASTWTGRQRVAVELPHRGVGAVDHPDGVDHRLEARRHLDRRPALTAARSAVWRVVGDHDREHVAAVRWSGRQLWDHHRPVLVDQPDAPSSPGCRLRPSDRSGHLPGTCGRRLDASIRVHVGAGVFGEAQRAVQQAVGSTCRR